MLARYEALVVERAERCPLTLITKDVLGWLGGAVGGAYGISDSMHHNNGVLWRPTVYGVLGLTMGRVCGLFPYHTLGVCLLADAAHTVSQKP